MSDNEKDLARSALFEFIEGWFNPHRRHSRLDYLSPMEYERSHSVNACYRSPTPSTETG
jgi:transposase InsO family protein